MPLVHVQVHSYVIFVQISYQGSLDPLVETESILRMIYHNVYPAEQRQKPQCFAEIW